MDKLAPGPSTIGSSANGPPPRASSGRIRFAGYAAVFDAVDRGWDVVRRGAFAGSLKRGGGVPLLWQHKSSAVIGTIEHLSEDARGLRVIGSVADAEAARLLGSGALTGLSFGYRVRGARQAGAQRELTELDLVEVSLVASPMQPKARVHAVENGMEEKARVRVHRIQPGSRDPSE